MNDADAPAPRRRYRGSAPFGVTAADRRLFFGRSTESVELLHEILNHHVVVLFAKSGIGKTSLLRAAVMHELRARDLWPVLVRLNVDEGKDALTLICEALDREDQHPGLEVTGTGGRETLWDLMGWLEIWRGDVLQTPVLIFDQFEEIFTRWDNESRRQFIMQFSDVLRRAPVDSPVTESGPAVTVLPHFRIVIALREEFLAELEAIADEVPDVLTHRYRLEPLNEQQAVEAIRGPAELSDAELETLPFTYDPSATDAIVDFLSGEAEGEERVRGRVVESVQLQIVCRHIEDHFAEVRAGGTHTVPHGDSLGPPAPDPGADDLTTQVAPPPVAPGVVVTAADLTGDHEPKKILANFYARELKDGFPRWLDRRRIRALCAHELISNHRRKSLEREEIVDEHRVPETELTELENRRILRSEARLETRYYELAHDSLVQAVEDDERARRRRRWAAFLAVLVAALVIALLLLWLPSDSGAPSPLKPGDSRSGTLDIPGDYYPFEGKQGRRTTIEVEPENSEVRVILELTMPGPNENVKVVGTPGGSPLISLTLPQDGTYFINVTAEEPPKGGYQLDITTDGTDSTD